MTWNISKRESGGSTEINDFQKKGKRNEVTWSRNDKGANTKF